MKHLIMDLEAPIMSFGREAVDAYGFTGRFPIASMLAGMLGNALGYEQTDPGSLQSLQDRLVFAARLDREGPHGLPITDYQTVVLYEDEKRWTTDGVMEGRNKSEIYRAERPGERRQLTWPRWQQYLADSRVTVALRLDPGWRAPGIDDLALALDQPARPLFIGRKNCLPSRPVLGGFSVGDNALSALLAWPLDPEDWNTLEEYTWGRRGEGPEAIRATWDPGDAGNPAEYGARSYEVTGRRDWTSRLHGGSQVLCEALIPRRAFAAAFAAALPE